HRSRAAELLDEAIVDGKQLHEREVLAHRYSARRRYRRAMPLGTPVGGPAPARGAVPLAFSTYSRRASSVTTCSLTALFVARCRGLAELLKLLGVQTRDAGGFEPIDSGCTQGAAGQWRA
ncbi:MAG: hypothetical protein M3O70_25000, partial [Actinomycetota bacterium]|nr:hypothetical protein [Actinomycetota bacterium]